VSYRELAERFSVNCDTYFNHEHKYTDKHVVECPAFKDQHYESITEMQ